MDTTSIHVKVGPLNSSLLYAPPELVDHLYETMKVKVEGAEFMPQVRSGQWDGKIRFFTLQNSMFLTGLLPWVKEICRESGYAVNESLDRFVIPQPKLPVQQSFVELRDYQQEIVERAFKAKRGIIHAAVNAGKTEMALELIRLLRLRTLYLVPSKELFRQFGEQVRERLPGFPVGYIREGAFRPKLLTIGMIQSIVKRERDPSYREFLFSIDCVIADEVHHSSSMRWSEILRLCKFAPFRYGLSATPLGMGKARDLLLVGLTGEVIQSVSTPDLVKRGLSTKTIVQFIEYHAKPLPNFDFHDLYRTGIEHSARRTAALGRAAKFELDAGRTVCVFVDTIEHGRFLAGSLSSLNPQELYGAVRASGRVQLLNRFRTRQRPFLITTLLKEGINLPEMDVLILAGGKRSEVGIIQKAGRVLRTRLGKSLAIIYDFIDHTHPILLEHSWDRYRAYKTEGYEIGLVKDASRQLRLL